MSRPNLSDELNDRDSATVQDALTRRCEVCKAKPGEDCRSLTQGNAGLPGRLVHYMRTAD